MAKFVNFQDHMLQKVQVWNPYSMNLGEDFAVFEFDNNAQRNDACMNLAHYSSYYGYITDVGPNETLLIIDTKGKE
jgi:hypothetical protein